jgi:hypothetical protein
LIFDGLDCAHVCAHPADFIWLAGVKALGALEVGYDGIREAVQRAGGRVTTGGAR